MMPQDQRSNYNPGASQAQYGRQGKIPNMRDLYENPPVE